LLAQPAVSYDSVTRLFNTSFLGLRNYYLWYGNPFKTIIQVVVKSKPFSSDMSVYDIPKQLPTRDKRIDKSIILFSFYRLTTTNLLRFGILGKRIKEIFWMVYITL